MNTVRFPSARLSLLALAAALMTACGGGQGDATQAAQAEVRAFASQIARLHPLSASDRERPQAITIGQVDAKALFDWAQFRYPTLFPKGPENVGPVPYEGRLYTARFYPNGNILGLRDDGAVFGIGPFTGGVLTPFGRLSDYAAQVVAEQCQVDPANCVTTNPPTGPLNECMMPAAQALAPGNRATLTYISYNTSPATPTSELTIEGTVVGAATFEGQSAIRTDTVIRGTSSQFGVSGSYESRNKSYAQAAANGLILDLGGEDESTFSGAGQSFTSSSKFVYVGGSLNNEFALQQGQSFVKSLTITSTSFAPFPSGPTTTTSSQTITFEGRERISVLAGTFDTCRYREVTGGEATITWYIVGKGLPARSQSVVNGITETQELKAGTFNGAPL